MGIFDYFKPVRSMTSEQVREFLKGHNPEDYNLIDVRQPREYENGHLPGAKLIPVGQLTDRAKEVDAGKPSILY